jgi:hypothetical protein
MSEKKIIHIWKGQEGTLCGLVHIKPKDGFVWFSQMDKGFNVNCERCLAVYDFERLKKITGAHVEYPDYEILKQQRDDLLDACKAAVRIKDLWSFSPEAEEHREEAAALAVMLYKLEAAIANANAKCKA